MYELYVSETCPYSLKVINFMEENDIPFEKKLISDYDNLQRLIELGGIQQVPFLYDTDENLKMYESEDIIDYVSKKQ